MKITEKTQVAIDTIQLIINEQKSMVSVHTKGMIEAESVSETMWEKEKIKMREEFISELEDMFDRLVKNES